MDKQKVAIYRRWVSTYVAINNEQERNAQRADFDKPFDYETNKEILRIRNQCTCRFCKRKMVVVPLEDGYNRILLCQICGYFGADGARHEWVGHYSRGLLAQIEQLPLNSPDLSPNTLIRHLNATPSHLLHLSPFRAEKVVMELLKEVLQCEVCVLGGFRDKGVDGYIVANDNIRTLVQVKWHESRDKAESVKVVREIAGTLLARGVPRGLLVTTRESISSDAAKEIETLNQREVVGIGNIALDVRTYDDIIDMLELAASRLGNIEMYRQFLQIAATSSGFGNITGKITPYGGPN